MSTFKSTAQIRALSAAERSAYAAQLTAACDAAQTRAAREAVLDALHRVEMVEHEEAHYAALEAQTAEMDADLAAIEAELAEYDARKRAA